MTASARARRLGARARGASRRRRAGAPQRSSPDKLDVPLGAKLELTHRCNLRCAFCYTDSPRRTLERPAELTDAAWASLVDDILDLGVLEAVVTGGEPLLRRELCLSLVETLGHAGVSTMLNTNGWHVDDMVAERLSGVDGLRVHISLDGATPAVHDASRGVPGGWRRALAGIDRLTARGIDVVVVHVLAPGAEDEVEPLLWQMWSLGVTAVRLTPIVSTGAAAGGTWGADLPLIRRRVASLAPPGMRADVLREPDDDELDDPRAAFLVRPNGDVVPDSRRPFAFGHAVEDGLGVVWRRIVAAGGHAQPPAGHVAYADPDVRVDLRAPTDRPAGSDAARIERQLLVARGKAPSATPDRTRAAAIVEELALRRVHALGAARRGARTPIGEHVRVVGSRHVHRLNLTAACVLDAAIGGTLKDAVDVLAARHPTAARERIVCDVLHAARDLRARGIIIPVASPIA